MENGAIEINGLKVQSRVGVTDAEGNIVGTVRSAKVIHVLFGSKSEKAFEN